jgi:chemotaxis protein methyltransferase CheR
MKNETKLLEDLEIRLLLEGIFERYGYDFRHYAHTSLKRRILKFGEDENLSKISDLIPLLLHSRAAMCRFLDTMSVGVTEMFRDPGFYVSLRNLVLPKLAPHEHLKFWNAGCSSGQEVYSMAILLHEENLLKKSKIYATDINEPLIEKARSGIYSLKHIQKYTRNHHETEAKIPFAEYYIASHESAIIKAFIRKDIVWAQHNLVSDRTFNEFDFIACRNVMIYFDQELQSEVHKLIYESLTMHGFLCLGSKENLLFSPHADCYAEIDAHWKIYQKIK